jgi:hypothetical protein
MRLALFAALLLAALPARALDDGPLPGEGSPAWDGRTFRRITDEARSVSFEVPMLGFRLEARHLGDDLPAGRVTDTYTLTGPDGVEEVAVELFDNHERLSLDRFFDRHLAFMAENAAVHRQRRVGPQERPAIVVEQPSLPGSYARVAAVSSFGVRVVRVTCVNGESPRAVAAYERLLETLALGTKR